MISAGEPERIDQICVKVVDKKILFVFDILYIEEERYKMDKKILVLNASSGISGDMTVGALLDLGADRTVLEEAVESLRLEGARVVISRVKKSALDACDFNVVLDEAHENHDHDMAYLHPDRFRRQDEHANHDDQEHSHHDGHEHSHHDDHEHTHHDGHEHTHHGNHEHSHHDDHEHTHHDGHEHSHNHDHAHHHHHGRNMADIEKILRSGNLTDRALSLAIRIFDVVAQAESKVHGEPVERVHFHEVGAVDSIIDITAAAVCIDNLGITDVIVTDLSEGTGTVMCQHGLLPIPVPATAQILSSHKIPFGVLSNVKGELITPTGAAILAALEAGYTLPERFSIVRTGLGAGKRDYATSGVLRAMLIEPCPEGETDRAQRRDEIIKLETNIDDCTGEALGAVMELLFDAGARDVFYTPVFMKKNRPAYVLNVICLEKDKKLLEEIIFRNTTTIGIREIICGRAVLERKAARVETPWGCADVKICRIGSDSVVYPEAESVMRLCRLTGEGYPEMYHKVKEYACKEAHYSC